MPEPSSWGEAAPALCPVPLYFCVLGAPLGRSTGHNYSGSLVVTTPVLLSSSSPLPTVIQE